MARDWADYLPAHEQRRRRRERQRRRFLQTLQRPRVRIGLCLLIYGLWTLALLVGGMGFPFALALLPLLALPPVGYLAWWLVWREFHH
jgi:hypothetical protein